ncbi:uncharacterized protein cd79b [Notothenia coriiceps]|uniref:Uncharacterized protein cd79b n=1 Tax=Notothenia coriiceps TaxID=8208 RepID=A0A6I9P4B2_9TELE|nr:PREDICTED: uncharacterized protein LOC104957097 [Notothenia coriiceps]
MRCLLAGCFGLALINISVALNADVPISQKPRFYGVNAGRNVSICCLCSKELQSANAEWYRVDEYNTDVDQNNWIKAEKKYTFLHSREKNHFFLVIHDVHLEDSGVYFCKINNTLGPGTAVQVARSGGVNQARRSKMKDALIILQGLLLAVCIAAVLLRKHQQLEKKDSIYEEPEVDHIYEGLMIETCSGGVYEELSVYAQADGDDSAEAPWE